MNNMTFAEAAHKILKQAGEPLTANEIASIALERGMISTKGKTPSATMRAQLYVDIKNRGDNSRFIKVGRGKFAVQLGKNRFALSKWGLEVIEDEIEKAEREKVLIRADRKRSIVGDPINFEGLIYGPLNENGVIFLFSKIHDELGINIEAIQPSFPDAKGRRKARRGWEDIWIEFEYKNSHFKIHNHDPKECDLIVCWEHDWSDCPIEVIELKKEIERVKRR